MQHAILSSPGRDQVQQWNNTRAVGVTRYNTGNPNDIYGDRTFECKTDIGKWIHLTLVGTTSGTTLYANGELKLPVLPDRSAVDHDRIGRRGEVTAAILDELKIYDEELSAAQVKELYTQSLAMAPKLVVTINGERAVNGGKKDLGGPRWPEGGRDYPITVGSTGTIAYKVTGGAVGSVSPLSSATDDPTLPAP